MALVEVNFKMDQELKNDMETLCEKLGLDLATAFTIFAEQMTREGKIPFEVEVDIPNEVTKEAIRDARLNVNMSGPFDSVEEMTDELEK